MTVKFYESADDSLLKFAVIAARHNGRWVFCKHRERNTYEIPGGHREENETITAAAKRELYEETGAVDFELTPVCVYSVTGKNSVNKNGDESFGMLYFACIKEFGELPQSEIEKIYLFDNMPDNWTYPLIQPKLIDKVISEKEAWDAYDKEGNKLGFDIYRDEPVPEGVYLIVVGIYTFSRDGRILVTQRAANKGYPLKWENTGGAKLKGETPVQGAVRELKEETGIVISEDKIALAYTEVNEPGIYKGFVALADGSEKIILQEGETVDYKWLTYDEYLSLIKTDNFVDRVADRFLRNKEKIEKTLDLLRQ